MASYTINFGFGLIPALQPLADGDFKDLNMRDINRGKYHKIFKEEFKLAKERLVPFDGTFEIGTHDYEAFIFSCTGLKLIFYPHKTRKKSNNYYQIRVRSVGKVDEKKLREVILALNFYYPMDRDLSSEI